VAISCRRCDETGWVCEDHPDRPFEDLPRACGCGAAGEPCSECNPSDEEHAPRLPVGFRKFVDKEEVAEKFWQRLRQARVKIETVTPVDLEVAAHSSAGSLVDRLNAALMSRLVIEDMATLADLPAGLGSRILAVRSGHSKTFALLCETVLQRRSIRYTFKGKHFELFPHVLGHTRGRERVHGYQMRGPSSGAPKGWRCFDLAELTDLSLGEEPWRELPRINQRCVESVHLDADPNIPRQPGRR
jgi:hypothetical protein